MTDPVAMVRGRWEFGQAEGIEAGLFPRPLSHAEIRASRNERNRSGGR